MDITLTPSDLFSPSKARQQRAQAQDWASVDSWLANKYSGRSPPTFERNEDTLRTLLALAAANERADEERELVENVEAEALKELSREESGLVEEDTHVIETLLENLTPEGLTSLNALASTSVLVNSPNTHPETLAHRIHPLITHSATLSEQLARLENLQTYLEQHVLKLQAILSDLLSTPSFQPPSNISQQTQSLTAQTKQLRAKLSEYTTRLSALGVPSLPSSTTTTTTTSSSVTPGDPTSAASLRALADLEAEIEQLVDGTAQLEAQAEAFKGLPPDREAARKQVRSLEREVERLRQERDGRFEGLVE